MNKIAAEIASELERANKWGPFNSAHEGYAVLAEEMDEVHEERARLASSIDSLTYNVGRLWNHVKVNQTKRDLGAMRSTAIDVQYSAQDIIALLDHMHKEAIQVAAMALKFAEVIDNGRGRV